MFRISLGLSAVAATALLGVGAVSAKVSPTLLVIAGIACMGALGWAVNGPHPD